MEPEPVFAQSAHFLGRTHDQVEVYDRADSQLQDAAVPFIGLALDVITIGEQSFLVNDHPGNRVACGWATSLR